MDFPLYRRRNSEDRPASARPDALIPGVFIPQIIKIQVEFGFADPATYLFWTFPAPENPKTVFDGIFLKITFKFATFFFPFDFFLPSYVSLTSRPGAESLIGSALILPGPWSFHLSWLPFFPKKVKFDPIRRQKHK